jgi:hypothetical protein
MQFGENVFSSAFGSSKRVLIGGAGGGYDVFCALPLYFALTAAGKDVFLASSSFSALSAVQCISRSETAFRFEQVNVSTVTLYRPVGPKELDLIKQSGFTAFPPRLPEQPIFYPVTSEEYAIQIARDWNVKASGAGYVTRFEVDAEYAAQFPKKVVGARVHEELWVPAEQLLEFNSKIVGKIEVTHSFGAKKT